MPFNLHQNRRLKNLIEELKEYRYREVRDIESFLWYSDDGKIANRMPQGEPETVKKGFRWKGYDRYNWLCTTITIPEKLKDEEVIGLFDFGVPVGTGNNSHFESLLYLNGKPYQGVDGNHQEVFFEVKENGLLLDLKFRVWSGLNGGGKPKEMAMEIMRAAFGVLDHTADDFYYLAKNAWEAYNLLDENNEYKEWLLNVLVQAFCRVDFTEGGSTAFYISIKDAHAYLLSKLDGRGKPDVSVSMVGHTHIDVAWLWRLCHTREKAARSFSTVNRLMEKYNDYQFIQSQAQLYETIKNDYPDIYAHIKKRVSEGKWEPSGAMWVECDCNIASGESIVRQILVGKNYFRKDFGVESEFLWLPDVFGYSWAIPQILKKSGVDTFMTTKISWNDTNKMPYDTFQWVGIDGTAVLTHFITTKDGWEGATSYTYNGDSRPYAVKGVWDNYSNKDTNRDLLVSYGYGDGGGGPTRDMIKNIECLNRIPGIPNVKNEQATSYFRRLHNTVQENEMNGYLPVWDGELYLEFHRGTYTSQAFNKKANRRMEDGLRSMEVLSVLAEIYAGIPYAKEELLAAWKIVLTQQFHDILPGSSIHEVYEDSHTEYLKAKQIICQVMEQIQDGLFLYKENVYTIWNDSNWRRDSYVEIPSASEGDLFTNEKGNELKSRISDGKALVLVTDMKPLSFSVIYKKKGESKTTHIFTKKREVNTNHYHAVFNEQGQIVSLFDKGAGKEILKSGKEGNVLQIFEDKPSCFDAWELEPTIDLKMEEISDCTMFEIEENELGYFVNLSWNYHKSTISQTICFYEDKRRIDFQTEVDWQEHQKLLKAAFPVEIRATCARYDIQYGNIVRPITRNSSWESAKFEVVAHKWVDMQETGYGVALLNDCKYGHDIKENVMRISLLKSAIDPDYNADCGGHEFTYALLPHEGEWYQAGVEQEAFDLNHRLTGFLGSTKIGTESQIAFDKEHIFLDCMKCAENSDEIIVRIHEFEGRRGRVKMQTGFVVESFYECNLMEDAIEEARDGEIIFDIAPYEIKTFALRRQ